LSRDQAPAEGEAILKTIKLADILMVGIQPSAGRKTSLRYRTMSKIRQAMKLNPNTPQRQIGR
jgi:hypothetical protein